MPKIIGESLEEHRKLIRSQVFSALTQLLAQKPYSAVSMADLASTAGIGRGALYNHFADKEAVVVAFATDETLRYVRLLQRELKDSDTPTDRMRAYIRHHLSASDHLHFGFGPELYAALSPEAIDQMREHVSVVEQVLGDLITDGIDAGEFAVADVKSAMRLIHSCLEAKRAEPAAIEEFILRGLGAP